MNEVNKELKDYIRINKSGVFNLSTNNPILVEKKRSISKRLFKQRVYT